MSTMDDAAPESLPCPRCDGGTLGQADTECAACKASRVMCGRFRLTKLLGRGGMGRIYEAKEDASGLRVAVKVLSLAGAGAGGSEWLLRDLFERSTHVLMKLDHPALPKVHAFEQDDTGRFVLVREGFDGGTLEERIAKGDLRLSAEEVRRLLEALLELLVYLQSRVPPVIHRDIKPSNVMFRSSSDDAPVLVDFDTVAAPEGRRTGMTIVGTPGYTAPEQFAGEASPSSDVYSLGTTMLFVVTHTEPDRLPRVHGRFDVEGALRGLDEATARVIMRMVEIERARRYENAAEALLDLRKIESAPPPPSLPRPVSRVPFHVLIGLVVVTLLGALGVLVGIGRRVAWQPSHTPSGKASAPDNVPVAAVPPPAPPKPRKPVAYNGCSTSDFEGCTSRCQKGDVQSCGTLGTMYEAGTKVGKDLTRAAGLYERACNGGYPPSCAKLGYLVEMGRGIPKDLPRSALLFKSACDGVETAGCRNLGYLYEKGLGVEKDEAQAATLYGQACLAGYDLGCTNQAYMYEFGKGVKKDVPRAVELYAGVCKGTKTAGCGNLAWMYLHGEGVDKDVTRAVALFTQACDAGLGRQCARLGGLYLDGKDVKKDVAKGLALSTKACSGGDGSGCSDLAWAYTNGKVVKKDDAHALELWSQACNLGFAAACNDLGLAYEKGTGGKKDLARALDLYTRACEAADATACSNLGVWFANGTGGTKDDAKAAAYDRQACDGGEAKGCSNLGSLTEKGRVGGAPDRAAAVDLFRRGCSGGNDWGCQQLKRLGESRDAGAAAAVDSGAPLVPPSPPAP